MCPHNEESLVYLLILFPPLLSSSTVQSHSLTILQFRQSPVTRIEICVKSVCRLVLPVSIVIIFATVLQSHGKLVQTVFVASFIP